MNSQLRRRFKCWAGNRLVIFCLPTEVSHRCTHRHCLGLHGRDDAFYKARFGATFWAAPGVVHEHGLIARSRAQAGRPKAFCRLQRVRLSQGQDALASAEVVEIRSNARCGVAV